MDSRIANERLSAVIKVDSITASQGDFLSTHAPIKRLHLINKFEMEPNGGKNFSEEQVYKNIIRNPEGKHQFVAVYGQSGTGKSHLIRWFEARFVQDKPENEVVLFIRRSDNTLKGTIRQLLEKPEVQGIANKEVFDRLVKASVTVDENKLKDLIYHNFIVELDNDEDSHELTMGNVKRKRLKAYLNNEVVEARMLGADGPIERIYSKIAENTMVDRDTVAQFTEDDFTVSVDFFEDIRRAGADPKAEKMARSLMADEDGAEEAGATAAYLNQFVNEVVQRCAGIEPGDFRQIFQDIRRELYRLGKNLTLFIEDVTSFTGVDDALLDALIVEHTGMNAGDQICRISSIVGSTSNYLQNNFRDNHKDRITQYVYIPSDAFDENGIYEFVGRYLNTMSLPQNVLEDWLADSANPEQYPVHEVKEGRNWEFISDSYGKKLPLYPFTRRSISYLYAHALTAGHKTPRYIIRDLIEPVVEDILYNKKNFPSTNFKIVNQNLNLSNIIRSQVADQAQAQRIFSFLSIWGDGTNSQYEDKGKTYISGIPVEILEELEMPSFSLTKGAAPKPTGGGQDPVPTPQPKPTDKQIPEDKQVALSNAITLLTEWTNGKILDISATVGTTRLLNSARGDLCNYLYSAINWQSQGISVDNLSKVRNGRIPLLALQNQAKGTGHYLLPNTWDSLNIICAFIKWREFGNESWDYPDSDMDVYRISTWTRKVTPEIVKAVSDQCEETCYIDAAIKAGMYSAILNGEFKENNWTKFNVATLLSNKEEKKSSNMHSKEWASVTALMSQKNADQINRETIRQYFNLVQGNKPTSIVVLDEPALSSTFRKVKADKLEMTQCEVNADDSVRLRQDAFDYLKSIASRAGRAVTAEKEQAVEIIQPIYEYFGSDEIDEDDILDLLVQAGKFYDEVNRTMIPLTGGVPNDQMNKLKKSRVQIARAISRVGDALNKNDELSVMLAFSSDPLSEIQPLLLLLQKLNKDLDKTQQYLASKQTALFGMDHSGDTGEKYNQEKEWLNKDKNLLLDWR